MINQEFLRKHYGGTKNDDFWQGLFIRKEIARKKGESKGVFLFFFGRKNTNDDHECSPKEAALYSISEEPLKML